MFLGFLEQEQSLSAKNKAMIEQKLAEIQNYKNIKKQLSVRVRFIIIFQRNLMVFFIFF